MKTIRISTPLPAAQLRKLKVGDYVLFSGEMYTMRDQAHKRLFDLHKKGKSLPFVLKGKVIYYCGPTPALPRRLAGLPGSVIGACGPTTSGRMDRYTSFMIDQGIRVFIGKGEREAGLVEYFRRKKAVYLLAIGGAGSYYSQKVQRATPVCFSELGPEGIYKLVVQDFPVIVGIDARGNYIYSARRKFLTRGRVYDR